MDEADCARMGLRVGLEVHQQLGTKRKLFCSCSQEESDSHSERFSRSLRASKSETGQYDPAAVFEQGRQKTIAYYASPKNSCLVERDEEPPRQADAAAKETALIVASALGSCIFAELFPMRKIVIDGSNPTGFQRTILVSHGGSIEAGSRKVGVQSICLEEDAAKLLGDEGDVRKYGLGRLGIPLIEIALEPVAAGPAEMRQVALSLGRMLRATRRVARGLGSIRQDVNVSISGGAVVEVKGVQQLDQLEGVVEFEARRQDGLRQVAERVRSAMCPDASAGDAVDVTGALEKCKSKTVQAAIARGDCMVALRAAGRAGLLGYSPYEGVRLGREIAQRAKAYGIGGIFHSDELPAYGIEEKDVEAVRAATGAQEGDAFVMAAVPPAKAGAVFGQIALRINLAAQGAPAETRLATQSGQTTFLRPRPGPSRMYPETDVPPIQITGRDLERAREQIPEAWGDMLARIQRECGLNEQLAAQVLDSEYFEDFESACKKYPDISANFAASVACSTITGLQRKGHDASRLGRGAIEQVLGLLSSGKIAKESVEIILEGVMSGKHATVSDAAEKISAGAMSEEEVSAALDEIIAGNAQIIRSQGPRAAGPLMGVAMKSMRGRASGELISRLLAKKISESVKK